jgi:hypothetical protein
MQIIELYIKGFNIVKGSVKAYTTNKLIDTTANFLGAGVIVGDLVTNQRTQESAKVTAIDSNTQLSLSADIFVSPNPDLYRIESDYFRADLFEDESVVITDSILNIKDIGKTFTPFSQQFNLPASKLNNKLFRHYENFGIENSFDARFRHDAIIKLNGIDYQKGKIQFKSVSLKDNKAHAYKVVFYGDAVELKEILGETKLSGLIYDSSLNFDYTELNIKDLFTNTESNIISLFGSTDILVPNIHHSKNMRYTNAGYKDNATDTELSWVDLKPAIRCRAIIEAINNTFPQLNITGFFNSGFFRNIYMWMHKNEGYVTNAEEGGDTFIVRNRWRHQTDDPLDYTHTSTTPSSYGDVRTAYIEQGQGTAQNSVRYTVGANVFTSQTIPYTVRIRKGSTDHIYYETTHSNGGDTFTQVELYPQDVPEGFLDIVIEVESDNNITMTQNLYVQKYTRQSYFDNFSLLYEAFYTPTNNVPDKTFYIGKQMPEMKVMDFLSGLFKMFNCVVYKDGNNIQVETAKSFMEGGNYYDNENYDITKYVDVSTSNVERLFQYKEMEFKFKSKKSFLVQYSDEIQGIPFAQESYGDNEWDGGVYKVEVPFEKMMYERLSNEDTGALTYIGQGAMLDKKFEPTIGEPLLFCMHYEANTNNELTIDGTTPTHYRRPSNISNSSWGWNQSLQLNFGLEADEWLGTLPDASTSTNLFEAGYLDYVETVFDRKARLYKVSAYLPLSLITKLRLNDVLIISNQTFRINSIKTNLLTNKTDLELYNKDEFVSQITNNQVAFLDRPTNVQVDSTTSSTITISWLPATGSDATRIYVNGGVYATPDELLSIEISPLESGTTYDIGVSARYDIDGDKAYSFPVKLTATTD